MSEEISSFIETALEGSGIAVANGEKPSAQPRGGGLLAGPIVEMPRCWEDEAGSLADQ